MIHLLSIQGKYAIGYHINLELIENFKTLVRGVTSGCVFVVSSKYKTDIFYNSTEEKHAAIQKAWSLYSNDANDMDNVHIKRFSGNKDTFSYFFQSLISLSTNWYWNKNYRDYFLKSYMSDTGNLLANKILDCDNYLMKKKNISRTRSQLIDQKKYRPLDYTTTKDTSLIAIHQLLKISEN